MTQNPPYALTPADIMSLRLWRREGHGALTLDGLPSRLDCPILVVQPSDGTLYLHSGGRCVAGGLGPAVMCALLLNERLEPGYCLRVCDPACTIEEALLDPASREAARRRASAGAAQARLARDDADEARRERNRLEARAAARLPPPDYSAATLDDFL